MMKSKIQLFVFVLLAASTLVGCATRPLKLGRRGLLDSDGSTTAAYERSIASGGQKEADQYYAPKEGEHVTLTGRWHWPLKNVQISSRFGERGSKFHQGVDLRAPVGTPVLAASDGEVVYVGSKIRGYGRMIVLKHAGNFYTVYAHHSKNKAKIGRHVKGGEVIAYSGKSGHSTGPHLHFELRRGTQSYDPEFAINDALSRPDYQKTSRTVASDDHRRGNRKTQ